MSFTQKKIVGAYELGKTLGKGTYSTVKKAYHVVTRHEVAIKIMKPGSTCDMEDIEREIAILKLLKHPNIIELLDVIHEEKDNKVYLVFELVNGGDLFDYTIARGRLNEREARRIMREVISAVAYCHANLVVHRDIKLENLLMDKDGHARIADFGMSGMMQAGLKMNTFCGSPMYMSPEIVQGLGYGSGVDIWSLGVVLYTITVGCTPWKIDKSKGSMVEDLGAMLRGEYIYPANVKLSPECEELISLMIVPEHAKRASIEQIMDHPWLAEGYDQPITVPMSITPVAEINEQVLKHMLAMGYSEGQTRKALASDTTNSPARMIYHHMLHQIEEGVLSHYDPMIPASPRKHTRHASMSPRNGGSSQRRLFDGRARAISDASTRSSRRKSVEVSPLSLSASPISPRTVLTSSWRQSQMSTISEENPGGQISTENPGPKGLKSSLPILRLPHPSYSPSHHSTPTSPTSPPSPMTSPRGWLEEPLVAVRGAFNVATTTLKPRRSLVAEIARVLMDAGIASSLSRTSVFSCKVSTAGGSPISTPSSPSSSDSEVGRIEYGSESESEKPERMMAESSAENSINDGEKLKFEVEVCRVAGLEMLLGVRFHKVQGNKSEYQEICKKLMASMKL